MRPNRIQAINRVSAKRRERGQSLIIAIMVMFALLFIGGIFVAMVARNLQNTGRTRQTVGALQFAEAGIRYADYYLQYSAEGADWRPALTPATNPQDPDAPWITGVGPDGNGPFSRVDLGNGRALIRVTTHPTPGDPLGKYIRIDAVGRSGFINPNDPTTYTNSPPPRLRRELVAYKAIGLTDYLRFVTNINNDSKFQAELGTPPVGVPVWTQFGGLPVRCGPNDPRDPSHNGYVMTGAPIRINGGLHLLDNVTLAVNPNFNESVLAAGPITVDHVADPQQAQDPDYKEHRAARFLNLAAGGTQQPIGNSYVNGNPNPMWSTYGGLIRDSAPVPDAQGYARSISRLDPPQIDAQDPATSITRYRMLTRNSGQWLGQFNSGVLGFGAGVYIGNNGDYERQTTNVAGGQSLRSLWLDPDTQGTANSSYWQGPYFIPPGAFIEFGYPIVQAGANFAARPGFRIVRSDTRGFRNPNGGQPLREMAWTFFYYKPGPNVPLQLKLDNAQFRQYLKSQGYTDAAIDALIPEFNGVIYAEGNIRVRGLLPSKETILATDVRPAGTNPTAQDIANANAPSVTVVSGQTIYVEGSLIREDSATSVGGKPQYAPGTTIALLAQNYVTVNTTMFVGPEAQPTYTGTGWDMHMTIPNHVNANPANTFDFLFGDNPAEYVDANGATIPIDLLMHHGTGGDVTYLDLLINEAFTANNVSPFFNFDTNQPPYSLGNPPLVPSNPPPWVWTIMPATPAGQGQQTDPYRQDAFQLLAKQNNSTYMFTGDPTPFNFTWPFGLRNTFRPDPDDMSWASGAGNSPYYFGRAAVVPMDVRIEAIIYAQNGSFFIIPGYPLNMNPDDTVAYYQSHGNQRAGNTNPLYPFYADPIDCRITVVGAITENRTASTGDQSAWMQRWGYIWQKQGSSSQDIPAAHTLVAEVGRRLGSNGQTDMRTPDEQSFTDGVRTGITRGIRFLYDPILSAPYTDGNPTHPVRKLVVDNATNTWWQLPPAPRLPVCPGFVFYGEVR